MNPTVNATVRRVVLRWDAGLLVFLVALVLVGQAATGRLLGEFNLQTIALNNSVLVCLAVGLIPLMITGDIDISVASSLALCGVMLGKLLEAGVPIWLGVLVALAVGSVLGLINGLVIVLLDLPSMAVTLGTLGAYTGIAYMLGGENPISTFPSGLTALGTDYVLGVVPAASVITVVLLLAMGWLIHVTPYGRSIRAVGAGREASLYSGVAVARTRILTYVIAGAFAGLAAVLYVGVYGTARGNMAADLLLPTITAVILGGVMLVGGSGTVLGVGLAVVVLATLQSVLGLVDVPGPWQTIAVGVLLILSVGLAGVVRRR